MDTVSFKSVKIATQTMTTVDTAVGDVVLVGTVSDTTFTAPSKRVTVVKHPAANTAWSRAVRLSSDAVFVLRAGVSTVAFLLDVITRVASAIEAGLTWTPPVITTQPTDQTVEFGGSNHVDFTIVAGSEHVLTYAWYESAAGVTFGSILTTTGIYDVGAQAAGTVTSNNTNVSPNDTVRIGSKLYTFVASPAVEGDVDIGADADGSLLNLIRAINHTGTPDTDYVCAAVHPQVTAASSVTDHAFAVTAKVPGTGANGFFTETSAATLSWGARTLAGGTNSGAGLGGLKITPTDASKTGYHYKCVVTDNASTPGSVTSSIVHMTVTSP